MTKSDKGETIVMFSCNNNGFKSSMDSLIFLRVKEFLSIHVQTREIGGMFSQEMF